MTDASTGLRPPSWCPCRWAPTWSLHTNLYKFGESVSLHIFHKKHYCDLNLGERLCISTFFLFPDSGLNLLNGSDFWFDLFDLFWMAWHWKPAIYLRLVMVSVHGWWDDEQWRKEVKTKDIPLLKNSVLHSSDQAREDIACSFNLKWSDCGQQSVQSVVVMTPESSALHSLKESAFEPDWAKQIFTFIHTLIYTLLK